MTKQIRTMSVVCVLTIGLGWLSGASEPQKDTGRSTPLIRDVTTGYLLNCFFMSPRPYCWGNKETVKLSGWEVDKSGGYFDYKPACVGKDFAFHSDWFKLVDTSATAAVTLKHQIARQTEGPITLEFRFKLPQAMDGASWQLRDMEKPAVSLEIQNGNLCCGKDHVLASVELNHDYGVKVIADLTAKKADVYIDGELKGKDCPFANPVASLDYFLVKTGEAATGEMFLNPVNIHKGYQFNETFVTAQPGKLPEGWQGKNATVEPFECGTKPDIFSLKVNGEASRKIGPWPVKTVFECKFLLPAGSDGVTIDLGGVRLEKQASYRWQALEVGDIISGVRLEKQASYRSNLWYMAKVIADPQTRTAEVYLNGKLLPQKLTFEKAGESLRFAGNLWVDDLLVYPWRDYPADYVPQPKPVKASVILGVQSCNLWREGTAYAGWDYVYPYSDKRKPLLGWYDEGHPEETDWEIKWQVEHGIGFEMHCWYRPNNAINHPIKDGVLDQGIIKGLFNARYSHLKKFAIMCTDDGACATNPTDWKENIIPYWIEYFFKDPRYMKIDGKPVLSIYHLGNFMRMMGGPKGAQQAIQTLRDEVAKAGFPGIIVLMEMRSPDRGAVRFMKAIGVDCSYAYTWGTPNTTIQCQRNMAIRDLAKAEGFAALPSISMGWGRQAWGVRDGGWLTADQYKGLARWTRDEFIPTFPADSLGRRIVMLANWNEFGEGHFLQPAALVGFGYLDALREVFTDGGPHEDAAPTDQQKRRFTVLFPKD